MSAEKPSAVTTYRQRDAWSRMVAREARVKLSHRNVLRSLALCVRVDKQGNLSCRPTYEELGKASLCSARTAMRAISAGEEIGIVRKARQSDGRVSNDFDLLMPDGGSNRDKNMVFIGATMADNSGSNGDKYKRFSTSKLEIAKVPTVTPRCHGHKAKNKTVKVSKNSKKGQRPALALILTRESNSLTATVQDAADIVLVAESAVDAPIAPALDTEVDRQPSRETANAARLIQQMLSGNAPIVGLAADLHRMQQPEFTLHAASPPMGRGARRDGGLLIDEAGHVIDEAGPPPKARAPTSYHEAIFG